jgi:hypothetical protein
MAKVTVSIPDDLHARMRAIHGVPPNWSNIAAASFEAVLRDIKRSREQSESPQVAIRLPFPTQGDYSIYEARVGKHTFQVKVSHTAEALRYRTPLERIVAVFARRALGRHPGLGDGEALPDLLVSSTAQEIDLALKA